METKRGTTLHCYRTPSWPTLIIDQDPERKSTTRMKKPTQRPESLISIATAAAPTWVWSLCFVVFVFVVWVLLERPLYFLSSWVSGFDISLFFVFVGFSIIFLFFLSLWVSWFFACLLVYAYVFQVLIYGFSTNSSSKWIFIEIEFVIFALL